jgi:hypothetical protein
VTVNAAGGQGNMILFDIQRDKVGGEDTIVRS